MTVLALIPPTSHIVDFPTEMSLLLAHRFDDRNYIEFYQRAAENDEWLILDNSAYETGDSIINIPLLLSMSSLVHCREIVVPDSIMDSTRTWARSMEAIHFMSSDTGRIGWDLAQRPRIMVVPQADHKSEDIVDYERHARILLEAWLCVPHLQDHITLGVSKNMNKLGGSWLRLFDQVIQHLVADYSIQVHCLGAPKDISLLRMLIGDNPYIRSLDTALPFVCAIHGIELRKNSSTLPARPGFYETYQFDDSQLALAHFNVDFLTEVLK